jgi:HK97 gp10 family phage protein
MSTVRLDDAAIRALGASAEVKADLESIGRQVADRARAAAPKATGAGAASITYETGVDADGAYVRVAPDSDHFYLSSFVELGTSKTPARPFLRPALEGDYTP